LFKDVFVSTDDHVIAEIAISFGAKVPSLRRKELSDDQATTMSVMQDEVIKLQMGYPDLKNICCIYPVTPLLRSDDLIRGFNVMEMGDWDYVFSATKVKTPTQRLFSLEYSKGVRMLQQEFEDTRTQDLEATYIDAGQFYWGKKISWLTGQTIFSLRSTILELPPDFAIDVDTLDDWSYAEYIFMKQKMNGGNQK
jgi:CMP-N-acetylneuraminic acid synthetase